MRHAASMTMGWPLMMTLRIAGSQPLLAVVVPYPAA
jgi:hypothetical protein